MLIHFLTGALNLEYTDIFKSTRYTESGKEHQLDKKKKELGDIQKKIDRFEEEQKDLAKNIDKLRNDLATTQVSDFFIII